MRRGDRLFEIIQVLRRSSAPITADAIAEELETSKRTIYRDIATLIAQRVPIRGEAGLGYVLERGFDLPPLMLTFDEIEAVVLGSQWVIAHADVSLSRAALDVLAKIAAIVPEGLRAVLEDPAVGTPPRREERAAIEIDLARVRAWSRQGRKINLRYADEAGRGSERTVWPFLVGYVASTQMIMAWCELRNDFRMFRAERVAAIEFLMERYPESPATLRRRWLVWIETQRDRERARR